LGNREGLSDDGVNRGKRRKDRSEITDEILLNLDFLGQNVRKYGGKLLIKPSKKSVKAFLSNVRSIVKAHPTAKQLSLIRQLNPAIRGWAEYHRHGVSSDTFRKVDYAIWRLLWRWAKRRHPKKNKRWVKAKYFKPIAGRSSVFAVTTGDVLPDGQPRWAILRQTRDTHIRRHIKIRGQANPFDPGWEPYFEQRLSRKMRHQLMGRRKLLSLWRTQAGRCVVCQEPLTPTTGWHVHHVRYRSEGGSDRVSNLVMVHPNCHRQIHSQRLTVVKPAPARGL
jgi:RNA-directed DNA polymerase